LRKSVRTSESFYERLRRVDEAMMSVLGDHSAKDGGRVTRQM